MATSDNVFLATDESVADVAGWVAGVLGLEPVTDVELKPGELLFRAAAQSVQRDLGVLVSANKFAEIDPEPDEIQAIDRYPIDLSIRLVGRKDEELQFAETRTIFDRLVAARPDVPVLFVHNLDTLVAAHLPGARTHTFDPSISPDAPDSDTWRAWVL